MMLFMALALCSVTNVGSRPGCQRAVLPTVTVAPSPDEREADGKAGAALRRLLVDAAAELLGEVPQKSEPLSSTGLPRRHRSGIDAAAIARTR